MVTLMERQGPPTDQTSPVFIMTGLYARPLHFLRPKLKKATQKGWLSDGN